MGGKVLEDDPGQRTHIQGVRLDNFARLSGLVRLGLRYSVGPWPLAHPGRGVRSAGGSRDPPLASRQVRMGQGKPGPGIKPQPLARCAR
jgi:hypothetical protein